jgi:hypothetical protein
MLDILMTWFGNALLSLVATHPPASGLCASLLSGLFEFEQCATSILERWCVAMLNVGLFQNQYMSKGNVHLLTHLESSAALMLALFYANNLVLCWCL